MSPSTVLSPDSFLEPLDRFRPDLLHVGRATSGEFGMVGRIPGSGGKLQCRALFIALDIAPEQIDHVGWAFLMLSFR